MTFHGFSIHVIPQPLKSQPLNPNLTLLHPHPLHPLPLLVDSTSLHPTLLVSAREEGMDTGGLLGFQSAGRGARRRARSVRRRHIETLLQWSDKSTCMIPFLFPVVRQQHVRVFPPPVVRQQHVCSLFSSFMTNIYTGV